LLDPFAGLLYVQTTWTKEIAGKLRRPSSGS
jgi:hypothetical protein